VSVADPAESFGWRIGRLVYRDEPLANVVADLNRQFPTPIRIDDPRLGQSRISGVLILDDQGDVLQRLALMLPVKAVRSDRDVLLQPR
jgi:transmembrane sensor